MTSRVFKLTKDFICVQSARDALQSQVKYIDKKVQEQKKRRKHLKNGVLVLEYLIGKNYGNVIELFEDTVTAGLQELFNEGYAFRMDVDRSGDTSVCEFQVATNECEYFQDLRMTQGKSLQEIISCLMRLIICKLDKNMPDVVVLDEPFSKIRGFRQLNAGNFLKRVTSEFGMQVIMVTQNQELAECADSVVDLHVKVGRVIC